MALQVRSRFPPYDKASELGREFSENPDCGSHLSKEAGPFHLCELVLLF